MLFRSVAAGVAASLGALWDASTRFVDGLDDMNKASLENTKLARDSTREQAGLAKVGRSTGATAGFGTALEGRAKQNVNYDQVFKGVFANLDVGTKKMFVDSNALKEVYLTNSRIVFNTVRDSFTGATKVVETYVKGAGDDLIKQWAFQENAAIQNRDALEKLRASYDASGKSSLTYKEKQDLLEQAYGRLAVGAQEAAKQVQFLQMTFDDMKKLQDLIASAQEVNNTNRDIVQISKNKPEDIAQGIDELSQTARNAQTDLANAKRAFDDLLSTLQTAGADTDQFHAFASMEDAKKFLGELGALLSKPNNGSAIADFLDNRTLTTSQKEFAKEYIKIEEDRVKATLKAKGSEAAFISEAHKRSLEEAKAQKEAAFKAADALGAFRSKLAKLGAQAASDNDVGLVGQISNLKSGDVTKALSGNSDLPKVLQDVITSTFVDGVKKAETDLSQVADDLAATLVPIDKKIQELNNEIAALGVTLPNTEDATRKFNLQQELTAAQLEQTKAKQEGFTNSLEAFQKLTTETKKAQEEAARAEAERIKKTEALTNATHAFNKSIDDANRSFKEFAKQKIDDLAEKQASAYEEVKSAQQNVVSSTESLSSAYKDYITTILQVNGAIAEAKIKSNLLGRDIGMLNGNIVSFQDKLGSLDNAFSSVLDDANIKLEQRIGLERQLAEQTLSFLQQAQDQITSAGINIFGQSAQENQGLQKGIAGLTYVADKLGGSFQNFLGMDSQEISGLSQELLNLPVEFRKQILDALAFLPSSTSIGGFSADQLKQAIGQVGAGVAPEEGLPAISELTAQQVEQLKILGQLGTDEAKLQLSQVLAAQKQLEKAQEQLDIAKLQEERAREGFELVHQAVLDEMAVIDQANIERRELLQKVIEADNANTLHDIETQSQLFSDQNQKFRDVGTEIVTGVAAAINAKMAYLEAQRSSANFTNMEEIKQHANGFIPNFANGNLSAGEAAGILRAAVREKKMMPNGANLAIANTKEAIIPMYKNFAGGNAQGSEIAAGISSIRSMDQTMVAAISRSVTNSLSQLSGKGGDAQALDKIAGLLTDLKTSTDQVRDSNIAIKTNTAGLAGTTNTKTVGATATAGGPEININLQTNQQSTVQITGLENLRDQLKAALSETTDKQVAKQIEALMVQLEPVFQSLNERGIISSFGQSK